MDKTYILKILLSSFVCILVLILLIMSTGNRPVVSDPIPMTVTRRPAVNKTYTPIINPQTNYSKLYWSSAGRLGNQMFEFASGLCIALQSNHTPTIFAKSILLSMFQIPDVVPLEKGKVNAPIYTQWKCCKMFPEVIEIAKRTKGEIKIVGAFRSYKYMLPCWTIVQKQFVLTKEVQEEVQLQLRSTLLDEFKHQVELYKSISQDSKGYRMLTLIGVHVRRTDMVGVYPTINYFKTAFKYYEDKYSNVVFIVCSDDIEWCEKKLPSVKGEDSTILFMSGKTKDYRVDFGILVKCHHAIITAGTFGWWAGWLAGGEVVYHTAYDKDQATTRSNGYTREDFYPEGWIPID